MMVVDGLSISWSNKCNRKSIRMRKEIPHCNSTCDLIWLMRYHQNTMNWIRITQVTATHFFRRRTLFLIGNSAVVISGAFSPIMQRSKSAKGKACLSKILIRFDKKISLKCLAFKRPKRFQLTSQAVLGRLDHWHFCQYVIKNAVTWTSASSRKRRAEFSVLS